jgi:hypothetical protein
MNNNHNNCTDVNSKRMMQTEIPKSDNSIMQM